MKKVLEGELLSLAHRVLQLKDKEVDNLFKEAKDLYEKLLILKFYQDHLNDSRINTVSPDQLDNALRTMASEKSNTTTLEKNVRHQMPIDLIEEDYPLIVEVEKEAISMIEANLLAEKVHKVTPEIEDIEPAIMQRVMYDEPFITEVYIDESSDEGDDALLHQYLDEHEAMLKKSGESRQLDLTKVVNEELEDHKKEATFSNDEVTGENERLVVQPEIQSIEGVEEYSIISVDDKIVVSESVLLSESTEAPAVVLDEELVHTTEKSTLEVQERESIEVTYAGNNHEVMTSHGIVAVKEESKTEEYNPQVQKESIAVHVDAVASDDPFFGFDFSDVEFVRVNEVDSIVEEKLNGEFIAVETLKETKPEIKEQIQDIEHYTAPKVEESIAQNTLFNVESTSVREPKISKSKSLNDIYNTTIVVGLNDRIAFERHLFNGSAEDFNRVLSQLNTVSSFDEANSLIEHLVRPEYNNWEGKDEYAERFMALVEKRFI